MKLKKHFKKYDFVYFGIANIITFYGSFIWTGIPFVAVFGLTLLYNGVQRGEER